MWGFWHKAWHRVTAQIWQMAGYHTLFSQHCGCNGSADRHRTSIVTHVFAPGRWSKSLPIFLTSDCRVAKDPFSSLILDECYFPDNRFYHLPIFLASTTSLNLQDSLYMVTCGLDWVQEDQPRLTLTIVLDLHLHNSLPHNLLSLHVATRMCHDILIVYSYQEKQVINSGPCFQFIRKRKILLLISILKQKFSYPTNRNQDHKFPWSLLMNKHFQWY